MKQDPARPSDAPDAADTRRRAEQRLSERHPRAEPSATEADRGRLIHELQVHQIELEMQNEELQFARDAMEAGLEKYSDLYDFAPVAYLTLDREGRVREANLTAATLFGIDRSRLIGRDLGVSFTADDRALFFSLLERTFQRRSRESCELTILRTGKQAVPIRIEAVGAASGRECRAALTDISESRRAERYRSLLGTLESNGSLAAGLAQDYGTLLETIVLNLELARTLTPPDEELLGRRIDAASDAATLAQELTRQILALAPDHAPPKATVPLAEELRASSEAVLNGHPVVCTYFLPEKLWPVRMDVGQLRQALRSMILNAREAMPLGGIVTFHAENVTRHSGEIHPLAPGDYVRLSITDHGGGMPESTQPRIFDPYFSTKPRGTRPGHGLGLTICQAIIQRNGGTIDVEATEGLGTTFHIALPASPT